MALSPGQSKYAQVTGSGPFSVTFASPLTAGNTCYLFVMGSFNNGAFATSDWTIESTNGPGGSSNTQYLLSRIVQGGDGATPPVFFTSTNAGFRVIGIEISGNPAVESIVQSTSTSAPVAGPTTTHNNDLGLLASGSGSGFGSYTAASGWTNDQNDASGSTTLDHIAVPTSGTSLTASPSWSVGGTSAHWMSVALMIGVLTGSGPIGTINLSAPEASGVVFNEGSGPVGTVNLSAPEASGVITIIGNGALGTISLSCPSATPRITATGSLGTISVFPPVTLEARMAQFGLLATTIGTASVRLPQLGAEVLATPTVKIRNCQMGLMVLATGGEIPPKPSPLTLMDAGRNPVMKQRLVNMYAEPTPQGPGASVRYQRPGLYNLATRGAGPIRASFTWNSFRVTVSGPQVWIDANNIGLIPADGLARYAFSDEELVIVSNGQAYYVTVTDVTPITDPDLPDTLVDVLFLAGRFIYVDGKTSQFLWSELGDARNIDGLSFATVAENTADQTRGAMVFVDNIVFFTGRSIEWWYPSEDPDAPFQRSQGRKNDRGLGAQGTMILLDNGVFFVGEDRIVYRTGGAVPIRVSNFTVEDEIRRVTQEDLPDCSAFGVIYGGHTFFVLHLVGRGTWALDVGLKAWAEWKSWNHPLFRVTCCDEHGVAGDRYSGQLMGFNGGVFTDLDDPIERIVGSFLPLKAGSAKNFNLALDCARGVGLASGYGSEPVVEMRYTDHESRNWTAWEPAPLGAMGDATDRAKAIWTQLGAIRAPGRLFEFRCTDPVQFAPYQARFNEVRP